MYLKGTLFLNFLLLQFSLLVLFPNFLPAFTLKDSLNSSAPDKFLSQMTLDEKLGQLFIIGFPQDQLDQQLKEHIEKYHIGSFIFFKRNMRTSADTRKFTQGLQSLSFEKNRTPALIAIDQEGGNVTRIETKPRMPYFFHLGDINNADLIYKLGSFTAKVIADLGFNLNLAPVLDLADPTDGSFISLRSFGSTPSKVSKLGYSYSKGLLDNNIIPTAKHFPGMGNLVADPHTVRTSRATSLQSLDATDLVPFKEYAKLGPNTVVMLSNVIYEKLDPTRLPASFSSYIIDDLLRKRVGFKGVVITDDLHMKSSSSNLSPSQAALSAIKAGADIVMLSWSLPEQKKAFETIKKAVLTGEISEEKINEKVFRILSLKKSLRLDSLALASKTLESGKVYSRTPASEASSLPAYSQSLQSIELNIVKSKFNNIFLNGLLISEKSICVASNSTQLFKSISGKSISQLKGFTFPTEMGPGPIENLFKKIDCEVYFLTVENIEQVKILNSIKDTYRKKIVIFNYTLPAALKGRDKFFSVIDLYGFSSNHVGLLSERIKEFSLIKSTKNKNNFSALKQ